MRGDVLKTEKRNIGAFTDPKTNDYIRWGHDGFKLYLSAVDCYRYAGVKRVEVPQGSSLKKAIRGVSLPN
ncbi:hypothetical protein SAMN04488030_3210 [Aliiroseovarius halocynthiae]|nr:hypothetical protein SAMN04488030_3210 [Aliiroseovarius halocynthiae]